MEANIKGRALFDKLLVIAPVTLAALALFGSGFQEWVRYAAAAIGIVLAVAWLLSEAGWVGEAIKFRFFRSKLSKDRAIRLAVLLDETSHHLSYAYALSPFSVWQSCANSHSDKIRMNYSYHGAVQSWVQDLQDKFSDPRLNGLLLIGSLSKAIFETTGLAEYVERALHEFIVRDDVSEDERKKIIRSWDSARTHFNHWIDKWQLLFMEVSRTANVTCVQYFRPLEMIG